MIKIQYKEHAYIIFTGYQDENQPICQQMMSHKNVLFFSFLIRQIDNIQALTQFPSLSIWLQQTDCCLSIEHDCFILLLVITQIQMGLTNSKEIINKIQTQYKPQRKYYDPAYGQITVIQHKQTRLPFVLIEKHFLKSNNQLQQYLNNHLRTPYFLKIQHHQSCQISVCSDIRLFYFLIQYKPTSLQMEIGRRQKDGRRFTGQEAIFLLMQQVEIVDELNLYGYYERGLHYKYVLKNSNFLCSESLKLYILEPMLRNDPEEQYQTTSQFYSSPQAYIHLKQSEIIKFRQLCLIQSSIIFTMALNFLQCLLLADISILYEQTSFNYNKLHSACQQILEEYGEQIYNIILKMTNPEPKKRIKWQELKRWLRLHRRKLKKSSSYSKELITSIS